jgi:hypothetical protein
LYFLIFPCRNDDGQPIHGIAKLALANMIDYVACPRAATAAPDIAEWKLRYEERRRISFNDVSW